MLTNFAAAFGRSIFALVVLILCFQPVAYAREGDLSKEVGSDVVTIYSDVCWNEEAGEPVGYRILVMNFDAGGFVGNYFVFLQGDKGDVSPPHATDATIEKGQIRFRYPVTEGADNKRLLIFSGKITPAMITGRFNDDPLGWGKKELHLKRQPDKHVEMPICR